MSNPYARFKALLAAPPLLVGTVLAVADGTATVQLPGGDKIQARGSVVAGDVVFVRGGVIEGPAPALGVITIDV